jgi:phosphoglycerate kinase
MNRHLDVNASYEFCYHVGTRSALEALGAATKLGGCLSIIGGGDTAAACKKFGMEDDVFTHISTGVG